MYRHDRKNQDKTKMSPGRDSPLEYLGFFRLFFSYPLSMRWPCAFHICCLCADAGRRSFSIPQESG